MNLRRYLSWQPFTPTVFLIGCAVALVLVVAIVLGVINGAREAAQTKVDAAMGNTRAKSATEAGQTVDRAHDFQTDSETLSRKNADAIRQAPGADQRLDPALADVARRRMCERASLRRTPECVQLLGPAQPTR